MTITTQPVIEITGLRKTYGDTVAADNVSLQVQPGEIFGVLGPNGAGKTTTVECLAGLRTADAGTVRILGRDPQRDPASVREVLGIQLQSSRLPAKITVTEALRLYAAFYADPADADELLALLGLHDKRHTKFEALSGGQQQRLSIALALIGNPQVAILDELTTGLDPQARRDTWKLVEQVRARGVTIVLVTHFMEEAERLCDRLAIIDSGRIVAEGAPAALIADLEEERTFRMRLSETLDEQVLHNLADVDRVRHVGHEIEVSGSRTVLPSTLLALAELDIVPDEIRTLNRSLEDVFVSTTGRELSVADADSEVSA
ncbi:ABC transporter ATP-binding protein [Pseudactinotalea sp. Z1748]|uniref:ABC transporter ATP-binding protein n=1 Tax=Pseudactinotalea sp. Z1748 TaxID=3413027 RepID=UPI003C7E8ED4